MIVDIISACNTSQMFPAVGIFVTVTQIFQQHYVYYQFVSVIQTDQLPVGCCQLSGPLIGFNYLLGSVYCQCHSLTSVWYCQVGGL